ncbi:hypothetical protein GCM10020367_42060 [Streptomyces sannanensis]|uniref:Lipoprotein n=1 Tax=Streptomyces sannanensis TaxID=285536 RepID=A0ABP6SF52_9ACTN
MTPFPRARSRRRRRAVSAVALCAGLAVALTGCGEKADPDKGTNGVGKLSAEAIEAKARKAAEGADAVRLSGTLVSKGASYTIDMRLKDDGGSGSVTSKDSTFELLRIGDELYMKADAGFWIHENDEDSESAAGKLDDKYVKVPSGDPVYQQLRGFTDKDVLLDGILGLHGKLSKGDRAKVAGFRTIRITGGEKAQGGALDVSLDGVPYPLRFRRAGGAGELQLTDWDTDFPLTAPSKAATVDYGGELPKT